MEPIVKDSFRPSKVKYSLDRKMSSLQFQGTKKLVVQESFVPLVTDCTDAIIRVTATTVCGSDLHLYHNEAPGLEKGDILGHESVGIVEEVGGNVNNFQKGDRVVISAVISCGMCEYCQKGEVSCCAIANTSNKQVPNYGHRTGALFGYTHYLGGYDGCQAEFVRVPFADVNLFPIPAGVPDMKALMVADIACTGYHGCELADIQFGDQVVIFGCGPVGLMAQMWAKYRGASTIIAIDIEDYRLKFAKDHFANHVIDGSKVDPVEAVFKILPEGPNKVIDCVGYRFPDSLLHKVERFLHLETDSPNIVNNAIKMVKKNGRITLIGDYFGFTNHFNIGALMEKHLTINGGQLWPHRYQRKILELIESGAVDPSVVVTHIFPFSKCAEVYQQFDEHKDGIIKPLVIPDSIYETNKPTLTANTPKTD